MRLRIPCNRASGDWISHEKLATKKNVALQKYRFLNENSLPQISQKGSATMHIWQRLALMMFFGSSIAPVTLSQCSGTTISGTTIVNQVWTACGSPYIINSSIVIDDLSITDGVTVMCAPSVSITIQTTINVIGQPSNRVQFSALNPSQGWLGLKFVNSTPNIAGVGGSHLQYCDITNSIDHGVDIVNSNPTFRSCNIFGNSTGTQGGGLKISNANSLEILIDGCNVSGNTAVLGGGGISYSSTGSTLALRGSTVQNNMVQRDHQNVNTAIAGGLYINGDSIIEDCSINGNQSLNRHFSFCNTSTPINSSGGGLYLDGLFSVVVRRTAIISNQAAFIYLNSSANFCGLQKTSRGSGIYVRNTNLTLQSCVISGSTSSGPTPGVVTTVQGAAIYQESGNTVAENITVARNAVEFANGSIIHVSSGTSVFANSIIWANLSCSTISVCGGVIVGIAFFSNCDVQSGVAFGVDNSAIDPSFSGNGNLPDSFLLTTNSPCIDQGSADPAFDDACFPPSRGVSRNDMGAFGGPHSCGWMSLLGTSGTILTYPGSPALGGGTEDLVMLSGINGTISTLPDTKSALPGDTMSFVLVSPNGTFSPGPPIVVCQLYASGTGPAPNPIYSYVYLNPSASSPIVILHDGSIGVFGPQALPPGGLSLSYQVPPLSGFSAVVQGIVPTVFFYPNGMPMYSVPDGAANGLFATSNAQEIVFQ
jgi:hypothetical protein